MFGDFFNNVGRYPSYFITIVLGIFISTFGWLAPLWKRPVTAVALVGFLVGPNLERHVALVCVGGLSAFASVPGGSQPDVRPSDGPGVSVS